MSVFNGAPTGSANFRLTWLSTGFTGYTIALQGSQDGSTWANIDSSLIQQSTVNPTVWTSATKTNTIVGVVYLPYVRVNVSSVTGTGTITSYLVGYKGFARTNSGGSGGAVSITATGPIVITPSPTTGTGVISCPTCATGSAITALTGDGTATGPGSVPLTLATVNSGPGTCGDSTHVCQVTTNGKGLTTSQTAVGISGAGGAGTPPYSTTTIGGSPFSIPASTHGQGQFAFVECWDSSGNPQVGENCNVSRNPTNGDLTITYVTAPGQVDVFGATGGFPNPMTTKGDIIYENATPTPARLPIGSTVQVLGVAAGLPAWGSVPGLSLATGGNPGPVPYVSAANTLSEDSSNALCIDATNHRVGVGTCSPSYQLQVNAGTTTDGGIQVYGTGNGVCCGDMGIRINNTGTGGTEWYLDSTSTGSGIGGGYLQFRNITAGTAPIVIKSTGNVGIGTTNPTLKLQVAGTAGAVLFAGNDTAPVATSCGTSPAVAASSTTFGGTVTEGTIATGCVVTFANTPSRCTVTSESGLVFSYALASNVLTITNVGALSSTNLDWTCTK